MGQAVTESVRCRLPCDLVPAIPLTDVNANGAIVGTDLNIWGFTFDMALQDDYSRAVYILRLKNDPHERGRLFGRITMAMHTHLLASDPLAVSYTHLTLPTRLSV